MRLDRIGLAYGLLVLTLIALVALDLAMVVRTPVEFGAGCVHRWGPGCSR